MRQLANPHSHILTNAQSEEFAKTVAALANPTRMQILSLLLNTPKGLRVMQLVGLVDLDQGAVSRHVNILVDAGFVTCERRLQPYRAVPEALDYVASFLGAPR